MNLSLALITAGSAIICALLLFWFLIVGWLWAAMGLQKLLEPFARPRKRDRND